MRLFRKESLGMSEDGHMCMLRTMKVVYQFPWYAWPLLEIFGNCEFRILADATQFLIAGWISSLGRNMERRLLPSPKGNYWGVAAIYWDLETQCVRYCSVGRRKEVLQGWGKIRISWLLNKDGSCRSSSISEITSKTFSRTTLLNYLHSDNSKYIAAPAMTMPS